MSKIKIINEIKKKKFNKQYYLNIKNREYKNKIFVLFITEIYLI